MVIGNNILVEIEDRVKLAMGLDDDGQTTSGFFVPPPEFQGIPNSGTVVAIGKDVVFPRVGDRIVFAEDKPKGFKWDGRKLFKLPADNVLGVFK